MSDIINIKEIFLAHVEEINDKVFCVEIRSEPESFNPRIYLSIDYTDEQYEQFLSEIDKHARADLVYITIWFEKSWSVWWEDGSDWETHFTHHELPIIPNECIPSGKRKNKKVWV